MKKQYRIFKIEYVEYNEPFLLLPFDHWDDTCDTELECECKIKENGKHTESYIIVPFYIKHYERLQN
jgi:hypothetical protein